MIFRGYNCSAGLLIVEAEEGDEIGPPGELVGLTDEVDPERHRALVDEMSKHQVREKFMARTEAAKPAADPYAELVYTKSYGLMEAEGLSFAQARARVRDAHEELWRAAFCGSTAAERCRNVIAYELSTGKGDREAYTLLAKHRPGDYQSWRQF
jgi:hypothetical protein